MILPKKFFTFALLFFFFVPSSLFGQYPEIQQLSLLQDPVFQQLEFQIAQAYRNLARGNDPGLPLFYSYTIKAGDDLFSLAARLNLPYETLATLNDLGGPNSLPPSKTLLIPSIPGIYIPNDLSTLYAQTRSAVEGQNKIEFYLIEKGQAKKWILFPGQRFHSIERAFFLGILFRFPIDQGRISSDFGPRANPFTGHPSFHNGIDIAAPQGTAVFSARPGRVTKAGWDDIYGNYVVVDHDGTYQTLYGHLNRILVDLNEKVASSTILGEVGSTGWSTGPHLHFEILRNGKAVNPGGLLQGRSP